MYAAAGGGAGAYVWWGVHVGLTMTLQQASLTATLGALAYLVGRLGNW